MVLQSVIEACLTGLGYELVELEHGPGGLLRVFIDFAPATAQAVAGDPLPVAAEASPGGAGSSSPAGDGAEATAAHGDALAAEGEIPQIRIEDCERVSHQLTHLLTVEGVDYARLEVSSPGLDRPLRKQADFERFAGLEVALRLKRPFEGRRNYEGRLTIEGDGRFGIEYSDAPPAPAAGPGAQRNGAAKRPGARVAGAKGRRQAPSAPTHKMVFVLDEIDRARLVPAFKF